jgi:hypothetical protein
VSGKVITIRRRWWAHAAMVVFTPLWLALSALLAFGAFGLAGKPDGWWVTPLLLLAAGIFGLVSVVGINALFAYRVEVDARGLRIIGNLYTHDITWAEITLIEKRHNHRIPGYHVRITVDGSRLPRRHWCNLWLAGYYIHPGMEKGGIELTAYLKRKRREYIKREAAQSN